MNSNRINNAMKCPIKILAIAALMLSVGCNSAKKQYLQNFEQFIVDTEKEYLSYEPERWVEIARTYKKLAEADFQLFEKELTDNELAQIERLKERFYVIAAKYTANFLLSKSKTYRLYQQVNAIFEELNKP